MRQIVHPAGRKEQPVRRRRQAAGVGDRRHLQRRLGAIGERVEHSRVHTVTHRLIRVEPHVFPDRLRRRLVVVGAIFCALSGADHIEPAGARPVDDFRRQRRLVAIGHRIDHPRRPRFAGKRRAGENIRLHIHHHDMLAGGDGGAGVAHAGMRIARGLHHYIDIVGRQRRRRVIRDLHRIDPRLVPPDRAAGGAGGVRAKIGDPRHDQTRRRRNLAEEHRAELAGPDQADPDRGVPRRRLQELLLQKHDSSIRFSTSGPDRRPRASRGVAIRSEKHGSASQ